LPHPHRSRPQGSCPSRRFWPRTRHARTPCGARRSPWRPDASRPCFMPLAPLESPFRAFPSRGAVPALAGLVLPCGFAFDRPTARVTRGVRDPFRLSRRPLAAARPKARRTGRPGRRFPGVARRRTSRVAALVYDVSSRISPCSPDSAAGTPTSKLCSPRESVPTTTGPWPGHDRQVGALLGFFRPPRSPFGARRVQSPLESAPAVPQARSARRRTWSGRTRASCAARTRHLATRIRQVLAPAVGSRTHGPPTCSADRAVHVTVRQRPCSQARSRSTHTPVASPVRSCVGGFRPFRPPR
jgi:hypothetical protein